VKYRVEVEVDLGEDGTEDDAITWMVSVLECAFKKKNPVPCPKDLVERIGWTREVSLPPSEHPYRPRVVGVKRTS
jgi:hypothetical protein